MSSGTLVISLDFELFWGVRDKRKLIHYRRNLENVHRVIPRLLQMFDKYNIHATWAYVGLLSLKSCEDYLKLKPKILPSYIDKNLSPYAYIQELSAEEFFNDCHNGEHLIELIKNSYGQELATHTFSHYYTLEPKQNIKAFEADLNAIKNLSVMQDIEITSIVFPRNQYDKEHLQKCLEMQISIFRGTPKHWAYQTSRSGNDKKLRRLVRLFDTYINLCGNKHTTVEDLDGMVNIRASSFLRPYNNKTRFLEPLKIHRIKKSMKSAAKQGRIYHLWWHPHNFGRNVEENLSQLESLCGFYLKLREKYGFKSLNMREAATSTRRTYE